jgi:histidinol phosphatase-like enzyme
MSKIFAVDLDDTLCVRPKDLEHQGVKKYTYCEPLTENIQKINALYAAGNTIIIYTARGMSQFKGDIFLVYSNLYHLTKQQLEQWGVKHHHLVMGKIHYDMLIDDKSMRPEEL